MVRLKTTLGEIMTHPVRTVREEWTLLEASRFFLEHDFSGAPVVDARNRPVGVLTLKDVARYAEWHLGEEQSLREERTKLPPSEIEDDEIAPTPPHERMSRVHVKHVMTPEIRTLPQEATVKEALELILRERFHRVFVTNPQGRLVGVVSALDIARWLKGERSSG